MSVRVTHRFPVPDCAKLNVVFFLATAFVLILRVLQKTHFHFSYTLDDPYIHLALAERIRNGFYGLNRGEPSSPSSSILWPFLLAPFSGTIFFGYIPLIINIACGACTAWLLGHAIDRLPLRPTASQLWRRCLLSILVVLGTNLLGLAFLGLEHSLQVFLCLCCAYAVLHHLAGTPIPKWTIAAAAVLPVIRYEGLLCTFVVAWTLWCNKSRRTAVLLPIVSLIPVGLFSLFLRRLGLPQLPISVIIKSGSLHAPGSIVARSLDMLRINAVQSLRDAERFPQLMLLIILAYCAWTYRRQNSIALVLSGCAAMGFAQVFYGPVGWSSRYELYWIIFALPIVLTVTWNFPMQNKHPSIASLPPRSTQAETLLQPNTGNISGTLLVILSALALVYINGPLNVGNAASSIYQQQGQLARLTQDFYTGPVAINDLGLVAYHRDPSNYVLDLVGLGSPEVYRKSQTGALSQSQQWLDIITREHGIQLVAIYPEWFGRMPKTWKPIGKLCTDNIKAGPAIARVMIYATPLANERNLVKDLIAFQKDLPSSTHLDIYPEDSSLICYPDVLSN